MKQTVLLEDTVVGGDINLPQGLYLSGKIVGNVTAAGRVEVMGSAVVIGNVNCPELYIEGIVEGDVRTHFLIIGENAVLKGKVETARVCLKGIKYDMKQFRLVKK